MRVCDGIVDPIGAGELIVPNTFLGKDGSFGFGEGVAAVGESMD